MQHAHVFPGMHCRLNRISVWRMKMSFLSNFTSKSTKLALISANRTEGKDWLFEEFREQIVDLLYRVDDALARRKKRIVQFISPGPDEGTTSISWGYARASAQMLKRRVLLLTNSSSQANGHGAGPNMVNIDDMANSNSIADALHMVGDKPFVATVMMEDAFSRESASATLDEALWQRLYEHFDEIVIDSPAPSESHLGRLLASYADAVVVVIEAEKTRDPVARKLMNDLNSVQANVIGSVLNKRRFYVPS